MGQQHVEIDRTCFIPCGAHQQYAAGAVDTAQTPAVPDGANLLMVQCFNQNIRYTLDGTAPTTTRGFRLNTAAAPIVIALNPGVTFKLIGETAGAAVEYQFGS